MRLRRADSASRFSNRTMSRKDFSNLLYTLICLSCRALISTTTSSHRSLFQFQSDAIRKAADERSCVFVGRCADYVLRDNERMVSIFISADMDERAARIAAQQGCDNETAIKIINSKESERANYYNYYTGKKWGHASSYDLCINTSNLGIEDTVEIIKQFIRKKLDM